MSYRIEYAKDKKHRVSRFPQGTGFLVAICVVALLAALEFSGLKEKILLRIVPGDAEVTAAAFEGLVTDLKEGTGAADAITSFCQEIVKNAKLPE